MKRRKRYTVQYLVIEVDDDGNKVAIYRESTLEYATTNVADLIVMMESGLQDVNGTLANLDGNSEVTPLWTAGEGEGGNG